MINLRLLTKHYQNHRLSILPAILRQLVLISMISLMTVALQQMHACPQIITTMTATQSLQVLTTRPLQTPTTSGVSVQPMITHVSSLTPASATLASHSQFCPYLYARVILQRKLLTAPRLPIAILIRLVSAKSAGALIQVCQQNKVMHMHGDFRKLLIATSQRLMILLLFGESPVNQDQIMCRRISHSVKLHRLLWVPLVLLVTHFLIVFENQINTDQTSKNNLNPLKKLVFTNVSSGIVQSQ